jgi:hypothetical protein
MSVPALFLAGLLTMAYAVAALFFARFWMESRDRLFGYFAAAFALLAVQRTMVALAPDHVMVYAIRLVAFIMIIIAIIDKNRSK